MNQFVEISKKNEVYYFEVFDCVNKLIFNKFFSKSFRTYTKGDDSASFSSVLRNDSIILNINYYNLKNRTSKDTTYLFKAWINGDLICFKKGNIGLYKDNEIFPDSISLQQKDCANNLLTTHKGKLYLIKKDTSNKTISYNLFRIVLKNNCFIIKSFLDLENKKDYFENINIEYKDGVVNYNDSILDKLIGSPVERDFIIANKINNFPLFIRTNELKQNNYFGFLILSIS